ncbi:hypothetical protein AQI95_28385 [Streptomyces yokosukanensis]|uniref:Uncharacterized protein n=1 Tax=Streptomyces yokosukanensis TaxID=67386 RepID=A0A101NZ84_9ACTN|nr:hypothetical protein AQI95_28385 [Streptomyces yokosukanensis]
MAVSAAEQPTDGLLSRPEAARWCCTPGRLGRFRRLLGGFGGLSGSATTVQCRAGSPHTVGSHSSAARSTTFASTAGSWGSWRQEAVPTRTACDRAGSGSSAIASGLLGTRGREDAVRPGAVEQLDDVSGSPARGRPYDRLRPEVTR